MNGINIDEVMKPLLEDELSEMEENERFLYQLTPEQTEAYLDYASYYNTAKRLKVAAKKFEKKGEALKTLFWMDIKDSSELAERADDIEDHGLRTRMDKDRAIIVSAPTEGGRGLPDFLRHLLDQ